MFPSVLPEAFLTAASSNEPTLERQCWRGKRSVIKLDSNEQFKEALLAKFVFLETQLRLRA